MKLSLAVGALSAIAVDGFVPHAPVVGFGRGATGFSSACVSEVPAGMHMLMGPSGKGGFRAGLPKISNLFKGKRPGGNNSGAGGGSGGGNKIPPPLNSAAAEAGDDGSKGIPNPLGALWAAYNGLLESQPLLAKALTSLVGFTLGDFLAQKFIDQKSGDEGLDMERLARMGSFGALIHGPTGHFFYNFLDSAIPGTAALTVAKKVFIDQVLWNPVFGCMFFGYMAAWEGQVKEIIPRIKNNLWTQVRGSWTVWPLAHAINFRIIPTEQRLLYINTIQIGYNMFLSLIAQNK